jgi:hypothetical protein
MSDLVEFINNEELSNIIMGAIPEKYKNTGEWEFTMNYADKTIDTLELWRTARRLKKNKIVIDLTKILTEFQIKQLVVLFVTKFGSDKFSSF